MAEVTEPPLVIVVDNLQDASLIERVFPPSSHALILVTARSHLLDKPNWPSVEIEEMSADEAISLARAQLPPDIPADDARRLAEALGCYPLAIVHAASLLGKGGPFTIGQFCRELDRNAGRALGGMTTDEKKSSNEQTLTFIYKTLLSHLERTFTQAADLLKATALLKQAQAPQTLLEAIFEELPRYRKTAPDDYDGIAFGFARRRLESDVLVSPAADKLIIHQIVQALIRSLIRGKDDSIADATMDGLNRWLRQTADEASDVTPWLTTIFSLVDAAQGRSLPPAATISLGDLLGWAMAAAFAADDHQGLARTRQTWFYQWITSESGADDEAIAGVQYIWLDGSDSEYEPTALARQPKRNHANQRISSSRKVVLTGALNWTDSREQTIRIPLPNGSVRLVQPIDQVQDILRFMRSGDNHEARKRAQSLINGNTPTETVIDLHLLLVAIAVRQGDLSFTSSPLHAAKELLFAPDSEGTPIQMGRLFQLEGDIAHRQYLAGRHTAASVKQLYEDARDKYRCEAIPLGRLEAERKLACVLAHASGEHAPARLRTLLHQAEAPLYGPIQHRIRLSLAKIALLRGPASIDDYDHYESCWSAAEFYAASSVSDRYWYVESLVTAYIVGGTCDAPAGELSLLFEAITREAPLIGRRDKAAFVAKARDGTVDVTQLLAD